MSKPWIFISPASRGIGHALTRHLLSTTRLPILATARSDPGGVKESILSGLSSSSTSTTRDAEDTASRLHVLTLDVTDERSVAAAATRAGELFPPHANYHCHFAAALPGILHPERSPAQVDYGDALDTLRVNVLGPLVLMKHFGGFLLPSSSHSKTATGEEEQYRYYGTKDKDKDARLPRHATFLAASARVGSTADNRLGGWYSYRASKAGVNSLVKTFDLHLRTQDKKSKGEKKGEGRNAIAVAYHPGTVKTGLSREFWASVPDEQLFSAEYAAERLVEVVMSRTPEQGGRCWDWKGEEVLP